MGSGHPSRFATFEMLRIAVPGVYTAFLLFILAVAFEVPLYLMETSGMFTFTVIVVSLIAGLALYAKETPKKRKAFQANQPSRIILERSRELSPAAPLTEDEARRVYFYILNHEMPAPVHDKIFFFGMVYHVMISIRRTSFWFGMLGFAGLVLQIALTRYMTPVSAATVLLVWSVYFITVRYNKADRKMQENYLDQIFWLEMNTGRVDALIKRRLRGEDAHA